jgi:hypothetical protein
MTAPFRVLSKDEFTALSAEERSKYIQSVSAAVHALSEEVRGLVELNKVLLENAKERRRGK